MIGIKFLTSDLLVLMKVNLDDYEYEYGKDVSNPTVEENGRSFTLINESKFIIKKWAIDKKVFKNRTEKRCDYLLFVERRKVNIYYWIELKGEDINEAYKQILSTVSNVNIEQTAVQHARVIATKNRTPDIRNKEYFKLEEIVRKSGGKIIVRINQFSEKI